MIVRRSTSRGRPTRLGFGNRGLKEAALLRGRLEGWTQALTRSILRDASLRDASQDEVGVSSGRNMCGRSEAYASLHHFAHNGRHLCLRKGAERLGVHIAKRASA